MARFWGFPFSGACDSYSAFHRAGCAPRTGVGRGVQRQFHVRESLGFVSEPNSSVTRLMMTTY